MTLTKANIVEALAKKNGYPKNQSFEMIETLLEIMKRTLESGKDVLVSGFGVIVHRPDEISATEISLGRQRHEGR
jgi:integration host factor subunit alpha